MVTNSTTTLCCLRGVTLAIVLICISSGQIAAQFPPAPGYPGTTAIPYDSSVFTGWATGCQVHRGLIQINNHSVFHQGTNRPLSNRATFGSPSLAIGQAHDGATHVVSLGDGGSALLTFDRPIVNGPGFDFAVFENSFSDSYLELALVEVSSDGVNFVGFPSVSLTQTHTQTGGFGMLDPTKIHNLAGKYRQGYGVPFDLDDIKGSPDICLNNIRYVRITDVVGIIEEPYCTFDSHGNRINDPWPTPFYNGGFDLDAVGIINGGTPYIVSAFDDLPLAYNSFWNGSDASGGFNNGAAFFLNSYDPTFGSWSGWSYSSVTDTSTYGFTNQFSAYTAGSFVPGGVEGDSSVYAVAFVPNDWVSGTFDPIPVEIVLEETFEWIVQGVYITNTTWAAKAMLHGDAFTKKFGGPSGNDPDWFKLIITGYDDNNTPTGTVEFFFADYRFENNHLDYVVKDWRWVDLATLGQVNKLSFYLESTDTGAYGINTPAYFGLDRLTLSVYEPSGTDETLFAESKINVFPNPVVSSFTITNAANKEMIMADLSGRIITRTTIRSNHFVFDCFDLVPGYYLLQLIGSKSSGTFRLVKK